MKYIFIENSFNFTSSSLNLKAIDGQKILINFVTELNKGHNVTVYNNIKNVKENGIYWKKLS